MRNQKWMSGLRWDVYVSQISIPGSHDSGTFAYSGYLPEGVSIG